MGDKLPFTNHFINLMNERMDNLRRSTMNKLAEEQKKELKVSFCGLKCTTFLRFKVHHSEEVFLFSLMARFV